MIEEYRRGIPTYKGENGQTVGLLCETKEQCITDDDGVALADKLAGLKEYTDDAYANSNLYTDTKIGELINGAPTTLDTLKEIADAMEDNADVVEALDKAVGSKVDQAEYDGHADNGTIHITAAEREAWNNNSSEGVQALIDGITPVGNANNLGGKSASEYMELAKYQPIAKGVLTTPIKEKALSLGYGVYDFSLGGSGYTDNDLPSGTYKYSCASVIKRDPASIVIVLWGLGSVLPMATSYYNGSTWTDWDSVATTADLANYVPKHRSLPYEQIDDIHESGFYIVTGTPNLLLHIEYDVNFAFQIMMSYADGNNMKWRAKQTRWYEWYESNNYLPKSGGYVNEKIAFKTHNNGYSVVGKAHNDNYDGGLELCDVRSDGGTAYLYVQALYNRLIFKDITNTDYHVLHTGNSAKCVVVDTDPGVGASVSYADGTLIFVKE